MVRSRPRPAPCHRQPATVRHKARSRSMSSRTRTRTRTVVAPTSSRRCAVPAAPPGPARAAGARPGPASWWPCPDEVTSLHDAVAVQAYSPATVYSAASPPPAAPAPVPAPRLGSASPPPPVAPRHVFHIDFAPCPRSDAHAHPQARAYLQSQLCSSAPARRVDSTPASTVAGWARRRCGPKMLVGPWAGPPCRS